MAIFVGFNAPGSRLAILKYAIDKAFPLWSMGAEGGMIKLQTGKGVAEAAGNDMTEQNPRTQAAALSSALQELHRALIRAEIGDDPSLENPYTMLFALIGDPRFAWMGNLSQLVVRIDETLADRDLPEDGLTTEMTVWRDEAAALIGEGGEANAQFRLKHLTALQKEPAVGLATGRLRKTLAGLAGQRGEQSR